MLDPTFRLLPLIVASAFLIGWWWHFRSSGLRGALLTIGGILTIYLMVRYWFDIDALAQLLKMTIIPFLILTAVVIAILLIIVALIHRRHAAGQLAKGLITKTGIRTSRREPQTQQQERTERCIACGQVGAVRRYVTSDTGTHQTIRRLCYNCASRLEAVPA